MLEMRLLMDSATESPRDMVFLESLQNSFQFSVAVSKEPQSPDLSDKQLEPDFGEYNVI